MHTTGINDSEDHGKVKRRTRRQRRAIDRMDRKSRSFFSPLGNPVREVQFLLGFLVATLFFVAPALAQDGEAKVRMVHLSPDAPAVKVTVDGEEVEALSNVAYLDATPYLTLPAGPHELAVYAVGDDSEPVLEVKVSPEANNSYTVAGVGLLADETFGARLFEDDDEEPEDGKAKVRVVHAIPDVGPAKVSVADGPDLFALPGFANASNYIEVDEGTYTLDVTPSGAEAPAFSVPDVGVEAGKTYTAFAIGQASEGTVGTIITEDSDDGEIVARTGAAAETGEGTSEDNLPSSSGSEEKNKNRQAVASKENEGSDNGAPEGQASEDVEAASAGQYDHPETAVAPVEEAPPEAQSAAAYEEEQVYQEPAPVHQEEAATVYYEEPAYQEPAPVYYEEPVYQEPVYYEQPVYHEEQVYYEEPAYYEQPVYQEEVYYETSVSGQAVDYSYAYSGDVSSDTSYSNTSTNVTQNSTQNVTSVSQSVSVGAVVSNQNAVLNSGARRKFVTPAKNRGRNTRG